MSQNLDWDKPTSGVTTFGELYQILRDHHEALGTNFAGSSFPTNPKEGQICFRTDEVIWYQRYNNDWVQLEEMLERNFTQLRSQIQFNTLGSYSASCRPGAYWVKDKWAFWSNSITTGEAAGGSPIASTWYYLYLDYSAITSRTEITTSTPFIWSTTSPSFSQTWGGWYNGDDRCIMAAFTNAIPTVFQPWMMYNNYVYWPQAYCGTTEGASDFLSQTPSDTWTDVWLLVPKFCYRAKVNVAGYYVNANAFLYLCPLNWGMHNRVVYASSGQPIVFNEVEALTNQVDQRMSIKWNISTTNTVDVICSGWYLPEGM